MSKRQRAPTRVKAGPVGQFATVLHIQMARLRSAWSRYLIVAAAMPLGIGLVLRAAGGEPSLDEALQITAGTVLLAVALTSVTNLAQRMALLKREAAFDYYATLPLGRTALLLAVFASYLIFALPGAVLVYLASVPLFDLSYVWDPTLLLLLVLGSFSLASIGAWIGLLAGDEQVASMLANLVMMSVLFLGIVTPSQLPDVLEKARWVVPSTYAVEGVRDILAGTATEDRLLVYCLVLVGFTAVFAPLAARAMSWRRMT